MTNLRSLLIDARQFVGKSRCSQGHSVSEVLDRAKPGDRHCLYCKEQAALHERLMLAVSELTSPEPAADPTRCTESGCGNLGTRTDGKCGYHTLQGPCIGGCEHDWKNVVDVCKDKPCNGQVLGRRCASCGTLDGSRVNRSGDA